MPREHLLLAILEWVDQAVEDLLVRHHPVAVRDEEHRSERQDVQRIDGHLVVKDGRYFVRVSNVTISLPSSNGQSPIFNWQAIQYLMSG